MLFIVKLILTWLVSGAQHHLELSNIRGFVAPPHSNSISSASGMSTFVLLKKDNWLPFRSECPDPDTCGKAWRFWQVLLPHLWKTFWSKTERWTTRWDPPWSLPPLHRLWQSLQHKKHIGHALYQAASQWGGNTLGYEAEIKIWGDSFSFMEFMV